MLKTLTLGLVAAVQAASAMPLDSEFALFESQPQPVQDLLKCQACGVAVRQVSDRLADNWDALTEVAINICLKLPVVLDSETVCNDIVPNMSGPVK